MPVKLLVPLKVSTLSNYTLAPPDSAELLLKILVTVNVNKMFYAKIAPQQKAAEFPIKLLLPVKLNTMLL